jgi:hypothetical protein
MLSAARSWRALGVERHGLRFSDDITSDLYSRDEDRMLEVRGKNAGGGILGTLG